MRKFSVVFFSVLFSVFAWSQATSAAGLSLGYCTHEEALSFGGTLEYALDPAKSIGLYATYLDTDSPVDVALKLGAEGKVYFLDYFYAGLLAGIQYNRIKVSGRSQTDYFADMGLQTGLNFRAGAWSFGPLFQFLYTVDFTNKGSSDADYATAHMAAFAKYNF